MERTPKITLTYDDGETICSCSIECPVIANHENSVWNMMPQLMAGVGFSKALIEENTNVKEA